MIDLVCAKCGTKLPVDEAKLSTRLFMCPKCVSPLAPPSTAVADNPLPAGTEDRTVAPDESALYIQQKLREAAEKRTQRKTGPVEVAMRKSAVPPVAVWAGGAGAAAVAVLLAVVLWPRGEASAPAEKVESVAHVEAPPPPVVTAPEPVTVASLAKSLKESSGAARKAAIAELGRRGPEANPARAALLDALADANGEIGTQAGEALGQLGPPLPEQLPLYAAALRSPAPAVRLHAVRTIAGYGQQAKGELVMLRTLTIDDDPVMADAARKTVAGIEESWMGALIAALKDKAPNVRSKAAQNLAEMGAGATPALPNLMEAMADKNPAVRTAVLDALYAVGPDGVAALGESLHDKNLEVRVGAIYALGRMGPEARPVLPDLVAGVADVNFKVRDETLKALERIGDYAIPYVAASLEKEKAAVKQKPYIEALGRLGPEAAPILAKIKDARPEVTQAAAAAIKKIEAQPAAPPRKDLTGTAGLMLADLRGWFTSADLDRDGYLDKAELTKAVRETNAKSAAAKKTTTAASAKDVGKSSRLDLTLPDDAAFLSRLDRDNDGKISRDEFDRWAYDFADVSAKQLDEENRIKDMQQRLRDRQLSDAARLALELAIRQSWVNYYAYDRVLVRTGWLRHHLHSVRGRRI
jgi:HEAT repeat protein/Ca2+-binding EF-hand superfamily protein